MQIITRDQWGFSGWLDNSPPARVDLSKRTEFFVHYEGGTPTTDTGIAAVKAIHAYHKGTQKWSGIGYSFIIDQNGQIFEGRGIDYQGAHCPDHNITGFGVQIHIGGDQQPTSAALTACADLYDHLCRLTGKQLAKRGHRDGFATECPGGPLYQWVKAGMPRPNTAPTPKEPSMGWQIQDGTKDSDIVGQVLDVLYNQFPGFRAFPPNPVAGRSFVAKDDGTAVAIFQDIVGVPCTGLIDEATLRASEWWEGDLRLHWENALPGGLPLDIRALQFSLAALGHLDWSFRGDKGHYGPMTTDAVNRFYAANEAVLGKGDGKIGPKGFGLLAKQAGLFRCTTPYEEGVAKPTALPNTGGGGRVTTPVPGSWVSAVYGQKPKNRTYWRARGHHTGRDYAASQGTPILAVRSGTVIVRDDGVLGCIAILKADNGRSYWYCHCVRGSRVTGPVKAGQQIAKVGQTGTGAAGPHLHLEDASSSTTWGVGLRDPQW